MSLISDSFADDRESIVLKKVTIWQRLCRDLQSRLKTVLKDYELITIAFIVERHAYHCNLDCQLFTQIFDIKDDERPAEISLKIHRELARLLERDYREIYLSEGGGEFSIAFIAHRKRLYEQLMDVTNAVLFYAEKAYQLDETEIPLTNIPDFLVPYWVVRFSYLFNDNHH